MNTPRRIALGIALGLLFLWAQQNGYLDWAPVVGPAGPVDHVVVVYESGDRTAEQADVMLGDTSNELRAVGKWRSWDIDEIPESVREKIQEMIGGYSLPVVILFHGDWLTTDPLPLPATDDGLRELIEKHGGF